MIRYKKTIIYLFIFIVGLILGTISGFKISKSAFKGISISYIGEGQEYLQEKKIIEAIAYFNKAVALDPFSFLAHVSLADAYYSGQFYELAIIEYKIALELSQTENGNYFIIDRIETLTKKIKKE